MRAWIQRGVETGAHFSYSALQLFSLEKCDEHRFKYLIALKQSAKLIQQEIKRNISVFRLRKKKKKWRKKGRKFCRENLEFEKWRKSCHPKIPFYLILIYIYISIDRPDTKTQNLNFLTTDYERR